MIDLTYAKQSNSGRMSGLNTAGQNPNPADEKAWQIQQKLIKMCIRDSWYIVNLMKYPDANLLVVRKVFRTLKDS